MQQPETQVSPNAAWQAARERAMRTTEALIVAEARIIDLEEHVGKLAAERAMQDQEYRQLKALMERRTSTLLRRAEAAEGVSDRGSTAEEGADANDVCEADTPQSFSD